MSLIKARIILRIDRSVEELIWISWALKTKDWKWNAKWNSFPSPINNLTERLTYNFPNQQWRWSLGQWHRPFKLHESSQFQTLSFRKYESSSLKNEYDSKPQ